MEQRSIDRPMDGMGCDWSPRFPYEEVVTIHDRLGLVISLSPTPHGTITNHRARQLATERRRKTLLVEYQALKKDNVFRDRRFGEDDPTLSLEEKMLLRFQKERQRRARAGSGGKAGRFNLEEGDGEEEYEEDEKYGGFRLTHKGRALGEDDYRDQDALGSSDDEDDDAAGGALGRQIVQVWIFFLCWLLLICVASVELVKAKL